MPSLLPRPTCRFRDGCGATAGVLVHQDVVESVEAQRGKEFDGGPPALPSDVKTNAPAAEAPGQVKGAKIPKGGWVGGGAWFGSVLVAVMLEALMGVYSAWIIKNNTSTRKRSCLR